ncbi:glycosyltransferase sugar-binding region containing DXD domain-containing protein [Phlyctema vagabunda]|uniref:Glycosyltransferase sugar-binding region containing DXD domain-containing protein n=1 Tax=Phlyctema vagabunda TaxID=108571 RepID=A0ABR4PIL7_9HELO
MHVTKSLLEGRLPKQMIRALPIYLACILIFLFLSKSDSIHIRPGDVVKRVFSYQAPLQTKYRKFPKKIWQTWKIDPLAFEERDANRAKSWPSLNPEYRYEVLTDGNDLHYVEEHFGPEGLNRLDIVNMYRSLTATIIKADLLRYLVMYVEGGVYADIDVSAIKPVSLFIPPQIHEVDVDLVISVEIDEPNFVNHTILGPKSQSFCQWTFMAKPGTPVIMRLINNVLTWLGEISESQHTPVSNITLNFDEVLTGTGPSAFTTAFLSEMSEQTGEVVDWTYFHALKEAKRVGNILVLPVATFAAGQGHSNSGDHKSPEALVRHHYHASLWPSRHPRYSHPAYGMVEECNWKPECVSAWDNNTAAFPSLPQEEKDKLIAIKVKADAEKFDKEKAEKAAAEKEEAEKKAVELVNRCAEAGLLIPQPKPTTSSVNEATSTRTSEPTTTETRAVPTETPDSPPAKEEVANKDPVHTDPKRDLPAEIGDS